MYTEILRTNHEPVAQVVQSPDPLKQMIRTAVAATTKENGWSPLSAIGSMLVKNSPSFDPRNYGCPKLGELVRKQSYLEVKEVAVDGTANVHLYVKIREQR